jgi:cytochrome c-type biogenesis protein CcmF
VRAHALKAESSYQLVSREVFLLANNIVFLCATLVVLTGTLFPLLYDVFGFGKISVGPPYFNLLFIPLAIILMILTAIGPWLNWKRNDFAPWRKPILMSVLLSGVVATVFLASLGFKLTLVTWLASLTAWWVIGYSLWDLYQKMAGARAGLLAGWRRLSLSYRGMILAHIGMAVMILGVTVVASSDVEQDVRLVPGDSVSLAGHRFELIAVQDVDGPNYDAVRAHVNVFRDERLIATMYPEKRHYFVQRSVMTEAAISPGLWRDLYVSLGESLGDGSWAVRVYYKPLMRWVWGGALIMALGGFIAIADRRYRMVKRRQPAPRAAGSGLTAEDSR